MKLSKVVVNELYKDINQRVKRKIDELTRYSFEVYYVRYYGNLEDSAISIIYTLKIDNEINKPIQAIVNDLVPVSFNNRELEDLIKETKLTLDSIKNILKEEIKIKFNTDIKNIVIDNKVKKVINDIERSKNEN